MMNVHSKCESRWIVLATLVLFIPGIGAVAQNSWETSADAQWDQQAASAAMAMLENNSVRNGNDFYVQFHLASTTQQYRQQGGFAPVLTPQAAAPPMSDGLMKITTFGATAAALPAGSGSWNGQVSVRIKQFSIYDPSRGWSRPKLQWVHFWQWKAAVYGGRLSLTSTTDATKGTKDGGLTEYVAAVFNVPVSQVTCIRPRQIPSGSQ